MPPTGEAAVHPSPDDAGNMLSQLIGRTRWRESDVAHVVVEIEGCVLDPVRPVQFESPGVLGGFQRSSAINPTLPEKRGCLTRDFPAGPLACESLRGHGDHLVGPNHNDPCSGVN